MFAFYRILEENSIPAFLLLHFPPQPGYGSQDMDLCPAPASMEPWKQNAGGGAGIAAKSCSFVVSSSELVGRMDPMDVGSVPSPPLASRASWLWQPDEMWMDGQDICVSFPSWESFHANSLSSLGAVLSCGRHLGWNINLCCHWDGCERNTPSDLGWVGSPGGVRTKYSKSEE